MTLRITEQEAREWKKMYEEDGMTIEEISLEVSRSSNTVKRWLKKMNTEMRKPGGQATYRNKATDGIKTNKKIGEIKRAETRHQATGHRRRGKLW